jgi:hypothetical protein
MRVWNENLESLEKFSRRALQVLHRLEAPSKGGNVDGETGRSPEAVKVNLEGLEAKPMFPRT